MMRQSIGILFLDFLVIPACCMGPFLDFTFKNVFTSSPYGFCLKLTAVVSLFIPHADGALVLKSTITKLPMQA